MKNTLMGLMYGVMLIMAAGLTEAQAGLLASNDGEGPPGCAMFDSLVKLRESGFGYLRPSDWFGQAEFYGLEPDKAFEFVVSAPGYGFSSGETGGSPGNALIVRWTGITAREESFTVKSDPAGAGGPAETFKFYGGQGFMPAEVPLSPKVLLLASGLVGLLIYRRRAASRS